MDRSLESEDIKMIRSYVDRLRGQKEVKEGLLYEAKKDFDYFSKRYESALKAQALIQKVAQETQKKLEYHIESLVTMAEAAVFPDPYSFEVAFEKRRNKTECDLWFVKKGERLRPLDDTGGGVADVASFALRCAFWSLDRCRPTMILDEPMKNVSIDLQPKCLEMVKEISRRLNIQIIMISHLPRVIEAADRVIYVTKSGDVSEIDSGEQIY
jgi:DNA repair exonuclease SbcCD ATPase subunit